GGIIAYGILYGDQKLSFFGAIQMTGRQLMIGLIGFVAVVIAFSQQWVVGAAYAAAMVLAWMMVSGKWAPRLWYLRWRHKRLRRHLKVVRDDDDPSKWVN
ncbi:MAG: hypothetical protein AAGC55_19665, partial [Myxococcota bacterium]